jgi:hypothetical protein
MGAGIQITGTT